VGASTKTPNAAIAAKTFMIDHSPRVGAFRDSNSNANMPERDSACFAYDERDDCEWGYSY
jgi:hypothetical protein